MDDFASELCVVQKVFHRLIDNKIGVIYLLCKIYILCFWAQNH